jgi:DNA-3-methyladenine glycosylase II
MNSTIRRAERELSRIDPVLARLIEMHGPCTLFEDDSLLHRSRYHVLVWAIINQQLSVKAALSIERKLLALLNTDEVTVDAVESLQDSQLAACGLSRQKTRYLRALDAAVIDNSLDLDSMHHQDSGAISACLTRLPGIGPWTVDMFLMFSLGRLDVLPLGDLALRKSFALHFDLPDKPEMKHYTILAEPWRPWRTVSSWYLWAAVD